MGDRDALTRWGGSEIGDRRWEIGTRWRGGGDGSGRARARRGKRRFEISGFFRHLTFDIRHCTERLRFLCGLLFDFHSLFVCFVSFVVHVSWAAADLVCR